MRGIGAALWAEALKARRSRVPWLTAAAAALIPLVGGLFMVILKDPDRARSLGIISTKAQLTAGVADWPTLFGLLAQATALGGGLIFSFVAAWVFGREFADGTVRELLAVPTPRASIVAAKLLVVLVWCAALSAGIFAGGWAIGAAVGLPGWSAPGLGAAAATHAGTTALALGLVPPVAFVASAGRGYLAPLAWALLALFLAQIVAATGWGGWFPWSVPPLFSGMAGPRGELVGLPGYLLVALAGCAGTAATLAWWRGADQSG